MADFQKALNWLWQGKKIRMASWVRDNQFITKDCIGVIKYDDNSPFILNDVYIQATNWEIYDPEYNKKVEELSEKIKQPRSYKKKILLEFIEELEKNRFEVVGKLVTGPIKNGKFYIRDKFVDKKCKFKGWVPHNLHIRKLIKLTDFYKLLEDKKREING